MAWSTREVAELAGTTLRAVRHYHDVGLLPEPERRSNGYKQYGVAHLTRLLRITRLVDLGLSLTQIADLGEDDEHPQDALYALDADLRAEIERLQGLRAELAEVLEHRVPTDLPTEFAAVRRRSASPADYDLTAVMGRLLGPGERATYAELLTDDVRTQADQDFDDLAADADEQVRHDLAVRMAAELRRLVEQYPGIRTLGAESTIGARRYRDVVDHVLTEVYNPAQRDVLRRLRALSRSADPQ